MRSSSPFALNGYRTKPLNNRRFITTLAFPAKGTLELTRDTIGTPQPSRTAHRPNPKYEQHSPTSKIRWSAPHWRSVHHSAHRPAPESGATADSAAPEPPDAATASDIAAAVCPIACKSRAL